MTFYRDIWWRDRRIVAQPLKEGTVVTSRFFVPGRLRPLIIGGFKVLDEDTIGFWTSKDIIRRGPENKPIDYELIRGDQMESRFDEEYPLGISVEYRWEQSTPSREISRK